MEQLALSPAGATDALASMVDLLRHQVATNPDRTVVAGEAGEMTAAELWGRSAALSRRLHQQGVSANDCVGVYAEPSKELMVGVWGALMSGAAYLPLSPEYPHDRVRYMIENAGARVIVTQAHLAPQLRANAPAGVQVLSVDDLPDHEAAFAAATTPSAADLAYVIYTSGSTGLPKGVMIEHGSIVNQMRWLRDTVGIAAQDRVLQKTPFSFDAAQWEILAPSLGATVVLPHPGAYRDPDQIVDAVREHGVTVLQCVPTLWSALAEAGRIAECRSLRKLFSGGEVLTTGLATAMRRLVPWASLTNLYGPTEATINATSLEITQSVLDSAGPTLPIGLPVTGVELLILGDGGLPVFGGEVGELHIGGVQVARGYLHNNALTEEKFITWAEDGVPRRFYRTGDLARWEADGSVAFLGRVDNQVKVNGYRVELDEVKVAIEDHHWVRQACVVPWTNPRTGAAQLAAFVELDTSEAALMDQGAHGAHHQSKQSRLQVRAQLSGHGRRAADELAGRRRLDLPGKEPNAEQFRGAFRRKTYRFYKGGALSHGDLRRWLASATAAVERLSTGAVAVDLPTLGEVLRWLGPFTSPERLLPKYAYASPGALNATQLYLEVTGVPGVEPGLYYHQPVDHQLVLIAARAGTQRPAVRLHLVGKRAAVETVYVTNVREVLAIEAGHMLGLLEAVLPAHRLALGPTPDSGALAVEELECSGDHYYLTGADLVPAEEAPDPPGAPPVRVYIQAHRDAVEGLAEGTYEFSRGELVLITSEIVQRKHVIAINQEVYDRSAFGVTLACPRDYGCQGFVELGRMLQRLQTNDHAVGLMSSGYSSLTGRDLPSARRFEAITNPRAGAHLTYFAVGGRVSADQLSSTGMAEDVVHMRGPAEILKDDLKRFLPVYMLPSRIDVVDELPRTANGKRDIAALADLARIQDNKRTVIGPRTSAEETVVGLWGGLLGIDDVSVTDDFFQSGGNSLLAVSLINRVNRAFGVDLPVQSLFEASTPEQLARAAVAQRGGSSLARLVALQPHGKGRPLYCWPGLGGFPMNLRDLGVTMGETRPFYGVQAYGMNARETPFATVQEMARADAEMLLEHQPEGPYTLLGYSFGARVAFETAYLLERAGHQVDRLLLIAPGSPLSPAAAESDDPDRADFSNPYFVQILLSVFTGSLDSPQLGLCRERARNEASFCAFVHETVAHLSPELIRRIIAVVRQTYTFRYNFQELAQRKIAAPVTILKAIGDDYSFLERATDYTMTAPEVINLHHSHYSILRGPGLAELADEIRRLLAADRRGTAMPHINIKHFPVALSATDRERLINELTAAVTKTFGCSEGVVSIALEPIPEADWNREVCEPEFVQRRELLWKTPNYYAAA